MRKPKCSLKEIEERLREKNDREQREQIEFEQHPSLIDAGFQPTPLHIQHLAQSNAEWACIKAQREQQDQMERAARLQEPPEPTDIEKARGQIRTARSLLLGTPRNQRKRH